MSRRLPSKHGIVVIIWGLHWVLFIGALLSPTKISTRFVSTCTPVVELVKTKSGFDLYINLVYYPPKLNVIMDEFSLRSFEPEMQLCSPPEVDRIWVFGILQ